MSEDSVAGLRNGIACLSALLIVVGCDDQAAAGRPLTTMKSVPRAYDLVVAGRPRALATDSQLGNVPFEWLFPRSVSFAAFDRVGVEELSVFLTATDSGTRATAAAALLRRTKTVEEALSAWRFGEPPDPFATPPVPEREAGAECVRLASGSFLPAVRKLGDLRFLSKDGQPSETGIIVGYVAPGIGHIEGDSAGRAIFTFEGVTAEDFSEDGLRFALTADVFDTRGWHVEPNPPRLYELVARVRNPETAAYFETPPIALHAFEPVGFTVPRRADVRLPPGDGIEHADTFEALTADGRLEVSLRLRTEGPIYLGVRRDDLEIRPPAFEFAAVEGRRLFIAQSKQVLAEMAAERGVVEATGDLFVSTSAEDEVAESFVAEAFAAVSGSRPSWADGLVGFSGRLDLKSATASARLRYGENAVPKVSVIEGSLKEAVSSQIDRLSSLFERTELKSQIAAQALLFFPAVRGDWGLVFMPLSEAAREVEITANGDTVEVVFVPSEDLRPPRPATAAVLCLGLGDDMHNHFRPAAATRFYRRAAALDQTRPAVRIYGAWSMAYNASSLHTDPDDRYDAWREGLLHLLDGVSDRPRTGLMEAAAQFLLHEAPRFAARRFDEDARLRERLARLAEFDDADPPALVAAKTAEVATKGSTSYEQDLLAGVAWSQHAERLVSDGRRVESVGAYAAASVRLERAASRTVRTPEGPVAFGDIEPAMAVAETIDEEDVTVAAGRKKFHRFDARRYAARFESDPQVAAIRRRMEAAAAAARLAFEGKSRLAALLAVGALGVAMDDFAAAAREFGVTETGVSNLLEYYEAVWQDTNEFLRELPPHTP